MQRGFLCLLLALLTLSACAPIGPNYAKPGTPVPDFWNTGLQADLNSGTPDIASWWRKFDDSTLNKLIAIAETQNHDLAIAAERIEEARALRGVARGGLAPTFGASGGAERIRESETQHFNPPNPGDRYAAGLEAGWELDFVGGLRRSAEAASASLEATSEVYHDTLVVIYAEVANSYVEYRTLQRRIALAQANIASQKESVDLTRDRKTAGLAPQSDVSQAATNLATTSALVPQLQTQLAATRNRLAVLVGRYPGSIDELLGGRSSIPRPRESSSLGIPADLVRSRPDLRAAERQLAAQSARIGVAKAELYPKFTLSGTFALQSANSGDLTDSASRAYSFGPRFRWRLFEGGAIRQTVKAEESRTRQALAHYEKTLLQAVAEVETSLASIKYERVRQGHLDQAVRSSRETVGIIKENYTQGIVDFQNVLDAERSIFANEDSAASSAGQLALYHIALYRALGGGTKMPAQPILNDKP
ncbi:MAG: efflux transporter outer membrane subunit [Verrucomicrobia bacterium]|nr:efflux transporter outer membrane subunit [Verrucomicrobiota bacterium]MDA1006568.1 efflux transporter outer membrane subunit [Verrucomicrobiota bacterium]